MILKALTEYLNEQGFRVELQKGFGKDSRILIIQTKHSTWVMIQDDQLHLTINHKNQFTREFLKSTYCTISLCDPDLFQKLGKILELANGSLPATHPG